MLRNSRILEISEVQKLDRKASTTKYRIFMNILYKISRQILPVQIRAQKGQK